MLPLLPLPKHISVDSGNAISWPTRCYIHPTTAQDPSIQFYLKDLAWDACSDETVARNVVVSQDRIETTDSLQEGKPGAYYIESDQNGFAARGTNIAGLRNALITLSQVKSHSKDLPSLQIQDAPTFQMRIHHDDISRKQISTLADFKRILKRLASYKITHYTIYIEDILHLESHPQLGAGRGKLMPDEVAELCDYATSVGIEIFPTFTLLGHFENILKHPQYAHLGADVPQMPSSLNPSLPATRAFLSDLIKDACALFPSDLFHMGFDETQGITHETFIEHANWCAQEVLSHGKQPAIWIDKFYNDFGLEHLNALHPAIKPVVWCYDTERFDNTHRGYFLEAQTHRPTWGLAGYSNWCKFIPDNAGAVSNIADWAEVLESEQSDAIACAQWGDYGQENHRDLSWHLFAAFAEIAWNGSTVPLDTFSDRFQRTFYGQSIPVLSQLLSLQEQPLQLPGHSIWEWHRMPHHALVRVIHANPSLIPLIQEDAQTVAALRLHLSEQAANLVREQSHLIHWQSAFARIQSVLERALFAIKTLNSGDLVSPQSYPDQCQTIVENLRDAKDLYRCSWLQNNRPENMEVSLSVFDDLITSYTECLKAPVSQTATHYYPVDLSAHYNMAVNDSPDMAFTKIDSGAYQQIPYALPGLDHVCWKVKANESTCIPIPEHTVADIHLIASCSMPSDQKPVPTLKLELLHQNQVVFSEDLLSMRHLCDWFDVYRAKHIWAGGGLRHVDASRVSIIKTVHLNSLCKVQRFPFAAALTVDAIRLTDLSHDESQSARMIAITLECVSR